VLPVNFKRTLIPVARTFLGAPRSGGGRVVDLHRDFIFQRRPAQQQQRPFSLHGASELLSISQRRRTDKIARIVDFSRFNLSQTTGKDSAPFENLLHRRRYPPSKLSFLQTTAAFQAAIKRQKDFGSSVAHAIYIASSLAAAPTWSGGRIPAAAASLHHQLNDIRLWF